MDWCLNALDSCSASHEPFGNLSMEGQQLDQRCGRPAPEAAFGGHAEMRQVAMRRLSAGQRTFNAIVMMDEAEEDVGSAGVEIFEWCEIGIVAAIDRHRHMHPIDAPSGVRQRKVRHPDRKRQAVRLDQMAMAQIAVTEMVPEQYRRRNRLRDALELRGGARPRI